MAWTATDIPDLTGRTAVVTGANGGLGLETTRALTAGGAHVVMAARNLEKAGVARLDVLESNPDAAIVTRHLDLGSLDSVREFAATTLAAHPRIDILIDNAGVMATPRLETSDGFELQFGTNHLGHFALTALLMPALLQSDRGRVVMVTSTARHWRTRVDPDDLGMERTYGPWRAYGRSKMANFHFVMELNDRLAGAGAGVECLAAHPGFANTDLQAASVRSSGGGWSQRFFHRTVGWWGMNPANGALPQLRAATDPDARGGELYTPRWVASGHPVRRWTMDRHTDERQLLWNVSERETGTPFDVATMVDEAGRPVPPDVNPRG